MTTVSIITPTYNRQSTLKRAIRSVQEQTYEDIEHIIIDDCSTDNTVQMIKQKFPDEVRLIELTENCGANAARNAGIEAANGDFISFLDSDDEYHPRRVERTVEVLNAQSASCAGVYHSYQVIENGATKTSWNAQDRLIGLDIIRTENIIGGFSATMFRRAIFDTVGYLDEDMPSSQDYEFYLRVLKKYSMRGISDVLANYHRSNNSISSTLSKRKNAHKRLLEKHGNILSKKRKSNQKYAIALLEGRNGAVENSKTEFADSIRLYPWRGIYYYYYCAALLGERVFHLSDQLKTRVTRLIKTQ